MSFTKGDKVDVNPSNTMIKGWRMGVIKEMDGSKAKVKFGVYVNLKTGEKETKTESITITDTTKIKKHKTINEYCWTQLFQCDLFCNQLFKTENEKKQHENECQWIYGCNICNKKFKDKKSIIDHCKLHNHHNRKMWECQICDKTFAKQYEYNAHKQKHDT